MKTAATASLKISPFLKWAGGKRWLVERYPQIFPNSFSNYYEPFLGSGAVFFHLKPKAGLLSDVNSELINTYRSLKRSPNSISTKLSDYQDSHSKKFYYSTRNKIEDVNSDRAARFLYLNRTCWNGLYRENKKGEFNVPKGTKDKILLPTDNFKQISKLLKGIQLKCQDFELTINLTQENDFIFVDPPYTVSHNNNGFIKYNQTLFSWEDQIRLKHCLDKANQRGVKFLVTNASHACIKTLYKGYRQTNLKRASVLAASQENRKQTEELIITNFQ
jgi:DNA adenine methylase